MKRIVCASGGTGGHMIPAQVIGRQLREKGHEVMFAGGDLKHNPYIGIEDFPYVSVTATPVIKNLPKFAIKMLSGIVQACCFLRRYAPDVVIGFGSYYSFPILAAALFLGYPMALFVADVYPGKVLRLFSPYAKMTGCYFCEAQASLKGNIRPVQFPLRPFFDRLPMKKEAVCWYNLPLDRKVVLVLGGSSGAKVFNDIVPQTILELSIPVSVIHLAGQKTSCAAIEDVYRRGQIPHVVIPFEREMGKAYAAADCVIARGGASTIAENERCQKPALYIPYPHAADNHQVKNVLAALTYQHGRMVLQEHVTTQTLKDSLEELLNNSLPKKEFVYDDQLQSASFVQELSQQGLI